MITKITKAYVRTYTDNGQTTAYVEWVDHRGRTGRTEAPHTEVTDFHMHALLERAKREGVEVERQRW